MKKLKRVLVLLLTLALCVQCLPMAAIAAEGEETSGPVAEEVTGKIGRASCRERV